MSSVTLSPEATALPFVDPPAWDHHLLHKSSTSITSFGLADEVAATLDSWGSPLVQPRAATLEFPADEAAAIEYIAVALGVTQKAALSAVRVPKRTYHGWKGDGHQPRARAKVRVWTMARAVSGLAAMHDNLPAWFHGTPEAQKAFSSGDAGGLALIDLEWATTHAHVAKPPVIVFDDTAELAFSEPSPSTVMSEDLDDLALPGSDQAR